MGKSYARRKKNVPRTTRKQEKAGVFYDIEHKNRVATFVVIAAVILSLVLVFLLSRAIR